MPTQAELDKLQERTKAQFDTIGRVVTRGGVVQDVSTNAPSEYTQNQTNYGADSNQRGDDVFRPTYSRSGGIPDGYAETEVILCQNGSPVNGSIIFKED